MSTSAPTLIGYFVVKATLTNLSPLYLGAGEGLESDKALSKSADGKKLIVHGSAIGGCIRSWIMKHYKEPEGKEELMVWNYFWGSKNEDAIFQSHFKVKSTLVDLAKVPFGLIDHVRINAATGTASDKGKFDREGLLQSVEIPLVIEVPLYSFLVEKKEGVESTKKEDPSVKQKQFLQGLLETIGQMLKEGLNGERFAIGAATNSGFGKLACKDYGIYYFDFPNKEADVIQWFKYRQNESEIDNKEKLREEQEKLLTLKNTGIHLTICMEACIQTSLLTRVNNPNKANGESDKLQFKYNKIFTINGSSIKGSVLHQMRRILNTCVGDNAAQKFINDLNGFAEKDQAKKGRFKVEMAALENVKNIKQDRVKIDMFTQGNMPPAKFDSEPVWLDKEGQKNMELIFHIECATNEEIALLLLTLRDFAEGLAAIGGEKSIGRGIVKPIDNAITLKLGSDSEGKKINIIDFSGDNDLIATYFNAWENWVKQNKK